MKTISNTDYTAIMEFLRDYADTPDGGSLKAFNRRRRARVLVRKLYKLSNNEKGSYKNNR